MGYFKRNNGIQGAIKFDGMCDVDVYRYKNMGYDQHWIYDGDVKRELTGGLRGALRSEGASRKASIGIISPLPIGSMYGIYIYMVTFTINIPPLCQHIYQHHGSDGKWVMAVISWPSVPPRDRDELSALAVEGSWLLPSTSSTCQVSQG